MRNFFRLLSVIVILLIISIAVTALDEDIDPAPIVNDEGGAVLVRGEVAYTNAFFTADAEDGFIQACLSFSLEQNLKA